MKRYIYLLILLPIFTFCKQTNDTELIHNNDKVDNRRSVEQKTTYYLIRHAEKDRTNPKNEDPNLNSAGLKRAERWATYFEDYQIDQIYTTKYLRNKETIANTALQKNIEPTVYDPHNIEIERFLKETQGKNVLIVGHSNTIPTLVNTLIGREEYKDMDDNDNSTLFKVSIKGEDTIAETITVK